VDRNKESSRGRGWCGKYIAIATARIGFDVVAEGVVSIVVVVCAATSIRDPYRAIPLLVATTPRIIRDNSASRCSISSSSSTSSASLVATIFPALSSPPPSPPPPPPLHPFLLPPGPRLARRRAMQDGASRRRNCQACRRACLVLCEQVPHTISCAVAV
jgi:hypothetical protein